MKLDVAEWVEMALILMATLAAFSLAVYLPAQLSAGRLLLYLSALLLLQSLLRDLWLLAQARRHAHQRASTPMTARCMCVESTVGATGVILGLIVLGSGFSQPMAMDAQRWSAAILLVLVTGFFIKDWVFELSPLRIRRDKHHMNIVVAWKKSP